MDGRIRRTWERISTISDLGSEHGDHGWKSLEEKNGTETLHEGFDSPKKRNILTPPPWVCYKGTYRRHLIVSHYDKMRGGCVE
jgi:hypothetical protein